MVICAQSADSWWMKASLLMEFGEFLYNHKCSKAEGRQLVQWAVDILLQDSEQVNETGNIITQVCMHQKLDNTSLAKSKN